MEPDMFNTIALILAVLIAGTLAYAATRPDTFRVARSTAIKAPPDKIFPLINDLQAFNQWNPFLKSDPTSNLTYSGPSSGKGAANEWSSKKMGDGRLEITGSQPPSKILMKLDMLKPLEAHNRIEFSLAPKAGETEVTWDMSGQQSFMAKLIGVFMSMDKMCGTEFEKGLADLKSLAEKG